MSSESSSTSSASSSRSSSPSPSESSTHSHFVNDLYQIKDSRRRHQFGQSKQHIETTILGWIDVKYPRSRDQAASFQRVDNPQAEKMTLINEDGKAMTWKEFAEQCATTIANLSAPITDRDCWFCIKEDLRLSSTSASGNKYHPRLHVFLKSLTTPNISLPDICHRSSRLCRRLIKGRQGLFCINPAHLTLSDDVFVDRETCDHGWAKVCDHTPKCLWTHPCDGARFECLELDPVPVWKCLCGNSCPFLRVPFPCRGGRSLAYGRV